MENRRCWCGCNSFYIRQDENGKGAITIVCQKCGCRRHVVSPGFSVEKYEIGPKFADALASKEE